jgi:hypothetical protein
MTRRTLVTWLTILAWVAAMTVVLCLPARDHVALCTVTAHVAHCANVSQ